MFPFNVRLRRHCVGKVHKEKGSSKANKTQKRLKYKFVCFTLLLRTFAAFQSFELIRKSLFVSLVVHELGAGSGEI